MDFIASPLRIRACQKSYQAALVVRARWLLAVQLLAALMLPRVLWAQTAGTGELLSIEAKVAAIDENDKRVAALHQQHLATYDAEATRLQQLRGELAALVLRKETNQQEVKRRLAQLEYAIENDASWRNRRESAQSGWQENVAGTCGAGGPPPICKVAHWHRVSVSEAMAEYEAYKNAAIEAIRKQLDKFDADISSKQAEIAAFQHGDNEFVKLREKYDRELTPLRSANDDLRAQIVVLSKRYKENVVSQAKAGQAAWISDLMRLVAEKHFIEDRIDILKVKLADLTAAEDKAIAESKEKTRKQNEADIQLLNERIAANKAQAATLDQAFDLRLGPLNQALAQANLRLAELERQSKAALPAPDLARLQAEKEALTAKITSTQTDIANLTAAHLTESEALTSSTKQAQAKSWELLSGLASRQAQALVATKEAFATKRQVLGESVEARRASLQAQGDLLVQRRAAYRARFLSYAALVEQERQRLVGACNKSGASCFGIDTHGTIVLAWNKASDCVGQLEGPRTGVAFYGCVEEAAEYKSHYNSLQNGLTDTERAALARRVSKTKYDLIYQQVQVKE